YGMELGATSIMIYGFREREMVLDLFEYITGLRMNMAYVRPGGVSVDLPAGAVDKIGEFLKVMPGRIKDMRKLLDENPVYTRRTKDVAYLDLTGCMPPGVTGPGLRPAGLPCDLRKSQPYLGHETYEFDVPAAHTGAVHGR